MKLFLADVLELLDKIRDFIFAELDPDSKTLTLNQSLLNLPFFRTLDPKKDYYKLESCVLEDRFRSLENNISFLSRALKNEKPVVKVLIFPSDAFFFSFFLARLPSKSQINLIFLKELWRFFRATSSPSKPLNSLNLFLIFELLKLEIYGFSIPSDLPEDYPLHSAIYSGSSDIHSFEYLLDLYSIDALDPLGNSAYKLALSLQRNDLATLLVSRNADCKLRAFNQASTGFEETVIMKDRALLTEIFKGIQRKKTERWEKTRFLISEQLGNVPDFECQMYWECDSKYLPFLGLIAPKDTCQIQKKGSNLNISLSVLGWSKGSLKTGDFLGVFSNADVYLVDRGCGKVVRMNENAMEEGFIQGLVDKALNSSKVEERETDLKTERMRFEVLKNLKGKPIVERIENYEAFKYEIKGEMIIKKRAFEGKKQGTCWKNKNFEEYFRKALKNAVFYYQTQNYYNKTFSIITHLIETYHHHEGNTASQKNNQTSFEQKSKNINATLWMIQDFQLNFQHIIPILEVLEIFSCNIRKFKDFLKTFGYKSYFPIKVSIPLIFSIYASITFSNFKFLPPSSSKSLDLFDKHEQNGEQLDQSLNESDQSLERAHQKFNSLVRTRNKTSINSDYFNIFEDSGLLYSPKPADKSKKEAKTSAITLYKLNEENIPDDEQKTNVQTPRILQKTLKTMNSKNFQREMEEINPQLQGIIKNALDLNKTINLQQNRKPPNSKNNKETVIMNELGEVMSPINNVDSSLDKNFRELDLILFQRLKSKARTSQSFDIKKKDADVVLKKK